MTNSLARIPLVRFMAIVACAVVLSASECPVDDNGGNGDPPPPAPTPAATAVVVVSGNTQEGTVGTALTDPLVVQVNDQSGNAMSGINVGFSVTSGGGTVSASSVATGTDGRASTSWTLGTVAGAQQVSASVTGISTASTFSATATADVADTLRMESGDGQSGVPNTALSSPLVAHVVDQYGNPVEGETVTFTVVTGGGSFNPTTDDTDAAGNAESYWTMGGAVREDTAYAVVDGLEGSPVQFTATVTPLSITAVSPDTMLEGGTITITGTGFDLNPANNTVTVDGEAAIVTAVSSPTSMTVTVPTFDCLPARSVTVEVGVSTFTASVSQMLVSASMLDLSVGEQTILNDPNDFCLQFAASATGGDAYLVGVAAAAETPTGVMPFTLASAAGAAAAPPAMLPDLTAPRTAPAVTPPDPELVALMKRQAEVEARIREYERRYLDPATNPNIRYPHAPAMGEPILPGAGTMAPADTLSQQRTFRVPTGGCDSYQEITATARKIGESGIWYTDNANPTNDSLTQADIDSASTLFDDFIFPFDTTFFGAPSDIDGNEKIIIVLTQEVNATGAAGFVYSGDLVPQAQCAYSDYGEIFYGYVPGIGGHTRTSVNNFLPVLIAHELTHNIQISRRRVVHPGGVFPASWIAEGQASFAEEVVGHAYHGNSAGSNYGSTVASSGPPRWYFQVFYKLGEYFGFQTYGGAKLPDAPEDCTLFGNFGGGIGSCATDHFYGASWSFLRYLTDRFYAGNESTFHKNLISGYPTLTGKANVAAVTGMDFDSLFAQWGAMLYADDRVAGDPAALSMTSWDLSDALSAVDPTAQLVPAARSFQAFTDSRSVRGGSNAYTLLSAAGAHPALAINVRDGGGLVLGTSMTPILWVVRIQ